MQVILLVFFAMAGLCVGAFAAHHVALVFRGITTYESIHPERCLTCAISSSQDAKQANDEKAGMKSRRRNFWMSKYIIRWAIILCPVKALKQDNKHIWFQNHLESRVPCQAISASNLTKFCIHQGFHWILEISSSMRWRYVLLDYMSHHENSIQNLATGSQDNDERTHIFVISSWKSRQAFCSA